MNLDHDSILTIAMRSQNVLFYNEMNSLCAAFHLPLSSILLEFCDFLLVDLLLGSTIIVPGAGYVHAVGCSCITIISWHVLYLEASN